jgi:adenosylcobinamide kinase/adenosylcobinamide-phosphate guanylyltransferase
MEGTVRVLILGGARSGKSRYAEDEARATGWPVVYIATGAAGDLEMAERIRAHQERRPKAWIVVEEPLALAAVLAAHAGQERVVLVDCLSLWIANLLAQPPGATIAEPFDKLRANGHLLPSARLQAARDELLTVLPTLPGRILLVSNEVGHGICPDNALARRFVDESGTLHQGLARTCERVVFVVAGLPRVLKGAS